MKQKFRLYLTLHLFLMLYSVTGILSKLAARESVLSTRFILYYGAELFILLAYAVGWQQFLKRMPLTAAYANKAVNTVWAFIWGIYIFGEDISAEKIIGVVLVVVGILLYTSSEK